MKLQFLGYFLIFASFFSISNAQNASLKGYVLDKESSLPLEFASISIIKKETKTIVQGTISDDKGNFSFSNLSLGNYTLKIVAIGYETSITDFSITDKKEATNLSVKMNSTTRALNEVIVKGGKSNLTNKLDKQTYKANQFESAKGGNAIDVLKNLPSVAVNSSGEISVRGSTGFLVLVNGKPVLADAQTILSQLPANTLENIELITAPSAKYEADGKAGIINITTKKGAIDGLSFQTNILAGLPSISDYNNLENPIRFGGDFTINFKQKKWDFSLSSNYNRNDANGARDGNVYTKDFTANTITRFPSNGERSFDRYNYGVRTAVTYTANDKNVFNLGVFASKKYQQRRADIVYNYTVEDLTTGKILDELTYFNSNLQEKKGEFLLGSFDYAHNFENKAKLSGAFIYEYANLYGNTVNLNMDYPNITNVFQSTNNPYSNPINGYRIKVDYNLPIGNDKLESGYQLRNDKQDGSFDYIVSPITDPVEDAKFRGKVKSTNLIHAFYSQYSGAFEKLKYTAGLRYEYAERDVTIASISQSDYNQKWSNLFPSANVLYTFNENWNAKLGYSKRVQRNNNFELNPIPEREHSETLEQGDPDLLPQFTDLLELGFNYSFKKGSLFTTLYYQNIDNPIQRVNSVYSPTILNRLFTNAENAKLIGLEMGTNFKPTKWFTLYLGGNVYNYKISGGLKILDTRIIVNNQDWVYSINMNSTFDLGKNWILQANTNYISARPTAQGEDSRFLSPNSSIKKSFLEGKFNVSLQWQNMDFGNINANQQRITTAGTDFYTTTNYIYETNVLLLNFSYNFNKLNNKTKLPSSELGEKEF